MNDVYAVRQTVCDMLTIRGYAVPPEVRAQTPEQVAHLFVHSPSRLTIVAQSCDGTGHLIAALFHMHFNKTKEKLGVGSVRQYARVLYKMGIYKAILVSHGLTPLANRELTAHSVHLEPFLFRELVGNILNHKLVPRHEPLTETERRLFFQKYKLDDLPLILHTDPVVRFLGLKDGDIVKITRPDFVAGQYVTYRRVVAGSVGGAASEPTIAIEE
jgi:DNA-directed RNA polymerase I, II, and III subunit RPABC1